MFQRRESLDPKARNPNQPNPPGASFNPGALGDRSSATNTTSATPHWLDPMERFIPTETLAFRNLALNAAIEEVERAAVSCEITSFATSIATQETQLAFIRYQQARIALASQILRSQTP